MRLTDVKLLAIVVAAELVKSKEGDTLLEKAADAKLSLSEYLLSENLIPKEKLCRAISESFRVNYVDLDSVKVEPELAKILPEIVARKSLAAVFGRDKQGIHLAVNDPGDEDFIKNFSKRVDSAVIVYYSDEESILRYISRYPSTGGDTSLEDLVNQASKDGSAQAEHDIPVIKIVDKILASAYLNKASDIHIEPFEEYTYIRYRIDGILHDIVTVPKNLEELLVTRLKIMSRLRTDEHRAAQDGRLRFRVDNDKVDARVSIVPVIHGEKIVMRLLSEKARQYDLDNLGFNPADLKKIKDNIDKPWGMILATGPTGSGKTTTLYAILQRLYTREVNISTIEDPVEYDMEGVNQIQVNAATGLTFAAGLRAIVRQDPDIIMVGEIRDQETASIAINSAMTGHLVLSTIHTNDAATTLPRLLDMGIKSFLVASTVNIAIGQRLVRKICPACRYKTKVSEETAMFISQQLSPEIIKKYKLDDKNLELYYGKGCPDCQDTGYQGRVGIYEILTMSEKTKELIMAKANAGDLQLQAIAEGMTTMIEDGLMKVVAGTTTIDEILRVTRE